MLSDVRNSSVGPPQPPHREGRHQRLQTKKRHCSLSASNMERTYWIANVPTWNNYYIWIICTKKHYLSVGQYEIFEEQLHITAMAPFPKSSLIFLLTTPTVLIGLSQPSQPTIQTTWRCCCQHKIHQHHLDHCKSKFNTEYVGSSGGRFPLLRKIEQYEIRNHYQFGLVWTPLWKFISLTYEDTARHVT